MENPGSQPRLTAFHIISQAHLLKSAVNRSWFQTSVSVFCSLARRPFSDCFWFNRFQSFAQSRDRNAFQQEAVGSGSLGGAISGSVYEQHKQQQRCNECRRVEKRPRRLAKAKNNTDTNHVWPMSSSFHNNKYGHGGEDCRLPALLWFDEDRDQVGDSIHNRQSYRD